MIDMVDDQRMGRIDNPAVHLNIEPLSVFSDSDISASIEDVLAPGSIPFVFI